MASEDIDRGPWATIEVVYPDGRAKVLSLDFPSTYGKMEWLGINMCECGGSIRYKWDTARTRRKAICRACGITYQVRKDRR